MPTMTIKNTSGNNGFFGYGDASAESTASFGTNGIEPGFYLANGASKSGLPYSLAANPQFIKDLEAGRIEVTAGSPLITLRNGAAVHAYFGYLPPTYPLAAAAEGPLMCQNSGLPGVKGLAYEIDAANGPSALNKDIAAGRTTLDGVVITLSAVTNGTISPAAGAHAINTGYDFVLTMTPASGYHVSQVLDNTVSKPLTSPYTINSATIDHTVAVSFAINTYAVTFDLDGGARTGGGALAQTINHGSLAVAPTYTPPAGYRIADVPWDPVLAAVTAITTYTALYTKVWDVTFDLDGGAWTGGGALAQVVDEGADATAPTYTAPAGYRIADVPWDNSFVAVAADVAVTALYTAIWTLTMAVGTGTGTITPVAGTSTVDDGVATPIEASAANFVNWTVTGGATVADANSAITTATLTADGSVTANWSV